MIICEKCGNDNPLGRVFCRACGDKLDLTGITPQMIRDHSKTNGASIARIMAGSVRWLLFMIPLLAFLALWPDVAMLGAGGEEVDGRPVENAIRTMDKAPGGSTKTLELSEEAINGYFMTRAEALKVKGISVDLTSSTIALRVAAPLTDGPLSIGPKEFHPFYTMDLTLFSAGNGTPVLRSARCGHMPMFGPLKGVVVGMFAREFEGSQELEMLKGLSEIKIDVDKLSITVKK